MSIVNLYFIEYMKDNCKIPY